MLRLLLLCTGIQIVYIQDLDNLGYLNFKKGNGIAHDLRIPSGVLDS